MTSLSWILLAVSCGDPVAQPVRFPHSKHARDLSIACEACHPGARESIRAGLPTVKDCAFCHRPERTSPTTPPDLAGFIETGNEIPWLQLTRVPRHVYFSHRRHALAKIQCEECHGDVRGMSRAFDKPAFPSGPSGMDRCIECHRKERITTDCISCHR